MTSAEKKRVRKAEIFPWFLFGPESGIIIYAATLRPELRCSEHKSTLSDCQVDSFGIRANVLLMTDLPPEIIQAIKQLQAGSKAEEDFFLIHRHFRGLVDKYFFLVGVPKEKIEDLTQTTFIRFYQSIKEFRGDTPSFKSWLLRTAERVNLDRVKKDGAKKRIQRPLSLDSDGREEDGEERRIDVRDPTPSPEQRMIDRKEIERILEILSQRQFQCLSLKGAGYTDVEISRQLNLSTDTVKTHLKEGRKKLRAATAEAEQGQPGD